MDFKFAVGDRVRIIDPDNMCDWSKHGRFTTESRGTILRCRSEGDYDRYYAVQWDDVDLGEWCVAEAEIALDDSIYNTLLADAVDRCIAGEIVIRVDSEEEKGDLMAFAVRNGKIGEGISPATWEHYRYAVKEAYGERITFSHGDRSLPVVPFSSIQAITLPDLYDLL